MIFAELSYTPIVVVGGIAAVSMITTFTSGFIRASIGHEMGLRSTKKDWLIIGIALILVILYFSFKHI